MRVGVAVEEVRGAQVRVALGDLGVNGGGADCDRPGYLPGLGDDRLSRHLAEAALDWGEPPHAPAPQGDGGAGWIEGPPPGERSAGQPALEVRISCAWLRRH